LLSRVIDFGLARRWGLGGGAPSAPINEVVHA
jgi:hypothetical protein